MRPNGSVMNRAVFLPSGRGGGPVSCCPASLRAGPGSRCGHSRTAGAPARCRGCASAGPTHRAPETGSTTCSDRCPRAHRRAGYSPGSGRESTGPARGGALAQPMWGRLIRPGAGYRRLALRYSGTSSSLLLPSKGHRKRPYSTCQLSTKSGTTPRAGRAQDWIYLMIAVGLLFS